MDLRLAHPWSFRLVGFISLGRGNSHHVSNSVYGGIPLSPPGETFHVPATMYSIVYPYLGVRGLACTALLAIRRTSLARAQLVASPIVVAKKS